MRSFIGRQAELAALHQRLRHHRRAALTPATALYGMGGIGKTQLARAYAHAHRREYDLGWWIPSETALEVTTAMSELAARLGAPVEMAPAQLVAHLHQELAGRDRWLLIFDNASDRAELEQFVPSVGEGHVLITSRSPTWQGLADPIGVDLLPLHIAARLLRDRTGDTDQAAAETLAEVLGRLPLAVEQAAAYAADHHLPLEEYLQLFRERQADLLARGRPLAYAGTVAATVTLTLDKLGASNPAALCLLELCSLLGADAIPIQQLVASADHLPEPLAAAAGDPIARAETVGALYQTGLLTIDAGDTARMHRLVQTVVEHRLSDRRRRVVEAVDALSFRFPQFGWDQAEWPLCARLLPHAQVLLAHARGERLLSPALANLLTAVGIYLYRRGVSVTMAHGLLAEAVAMLQQLHYGDHPDLAHSLNWLANSAYASGALVRARGLKEEALAMRRRLYPGDHPDVAHSIDNLAVTLRALGELRHARDLHWEALAMRRRLYRGDHRSLAYGLSGLAVTLRLSGGLLGARELHEQALAMRRRLYRGDHPEIATSLSALATTMRELGDLRRARELHEQALAMRERLHRGDHRSMPGNLNEFVITLRALGKLAKARDVHERAIAMQRRLYRGDHPVLARCLYHLAVTSRRLGNLARARDLHEQALAMRQRLYPGDHLELAESLEGVADCARGRGDREAARSWDDQASSMRQRLNEAP